MSVGKKKKQEQCKEFQCRVTTTYSHKNVQNELFKLHTGTALILQEVPLISPTTFIT